MELVRKIRVQVEGGLHARPAAEIVRRAKGFASEIMLEAHAQTAVARSSLKLLMLSVKEGDEVTLRVRGEDAQPALDAISSFLSGDASAVPQADPAPPAPQADPAPQHPTPPAARQGELSGVPVSPGQASGPVFALRQPALDPEPETVGPEAMAPELARATMAMTAVADRCRRAAGQAADPATRDVLAALAEFAADADWADDVARRIGAGAGAMAALQGSAAALVASIAALPDAYARARAEDMRAAGDLVALELQGKRPVTLADAPSGAVVVAEELAAVHLGHADLSAVAGLIAARGAATGHAAILARAAGVPAVFGLGDGIADVLAAGHVALDGATGTVIPNPDDATLAKVRAGAEAMRAEAADLARLTALRPTTRDGVAVTVAANIGAMADADRALAAGAMGVGLFRTEFLFLDRSTLPSEEEQYRTYRAVLERFPEDHVTIRTLDIGGDKPARAIAMEREENPFLGLRGIRLCLARPHVFRVQLRALLRAACHGRLQVMLPMVGDVGELRATHALIAACSTELASEGVPHAPFPLGIMIETPAAVFCAAEFAREAAFFSIGTNDLTQYVMAADRTNAAVASLCRSDNPAVMAAIRQVCDAARVTGIPVGVCGEAAADPALIPALLGAGVRELSMSANAILRTKRQLAGLTLGMAGVDFHLELSRVFHREVRHF